MSNPYAAPTADLSQFNNDGETYTPKMLQVNGRIGRVRYLCYTMVLTLILMFAVGLATAVLSMINPMLAMLGMILYLPALAASFIMAIRRLNDMNQSGWLCILTLIPIVNIFVGLWLVFGPGTQGSNSYGLPPSRNTRMIVIGAWLPLIVIAILAAIAVPAYQKYVTKAALARQALETPIEAPRP